MKSKDMHRKSTKSAKKKRTPKIQPTPEPKINRFHFDERSFEKTVADLAEKVFRYFQALYGPESIYAYGLTGYEAFEDLYPFVMSEQMLNDESGSSSDNKERYQRMLFIDQRFEDNDDLQSLIRITSKLGAQFRGMVDSAKSILPEGELTQIISMHTQNYTQACLNALQTLDRKGLFEEGLSREKVTLFLWYTDFPYAKDDVTHIELLNPPIVIERYHAERARADRFNS